jgi:cytochrome c oxidase subunit 4
MTSAAPQHKSHPSYYLIWVVLGVLTGIELYISSLGVKFNWDKTIVIVILVALAVWKAVLVALYYMHLRFEPRRLRILAIAPLPLAVILVVVVTREYIWK